MKYQEAYTSLLLMLSGALREEFIGNKKIQEDLEILQKLISEYDMLLDTNNQFEKENIKLEKTLEEAIENHILPHCTYEKEECLDGDCVKCWKEYLLRESEIK